MKSYSEALGSSENHGAMDCNMTKKIFQEVVAEEDRSKAPKLLCRSLACLRIELGHASALVQNVLNECDWMQGPF